MNRIKTAALTGAGGLLGSHIFMKLLQKGYHVRLLLRKPAQTIAELKILFSACGITWPSADDFTVVQGDILELDSLEQFIHNADVVFHAAASVAEVGLDRNSLLKINAEGTANLVNLCLSLSNIRFIHISSVATLGPNPGELSDEDYFFKASPRTSDYAISKYAAEQEVWRGVEEGLNAAILNPSFIVGPSVSSRSGSAVFSNLQKGLPAYVEGLAGYVDVVDVAEAAVRLAESNICGERLICSAENLMISDFLKQAAVAMRAKIPTLRLSLFWFRPAAFLERVRAFLFRRSPRYNLQTLRMASGEQAFDGKRILEKLPGFRYSSVQEAILRTGQIMKKFST